MWSSYRTELPQARGLQIAVDLDSRPATYAEVIESWRFDATFRLWFVELLKQAPYEAYRWETPGVTSAALGRPFEFVQLDSPGLAARPDRKAFAEHYAGAVDGIVTFANLSGDATLVVPAPPTAAASYGHLAAFLRNAQPSQSDALWQHVGEAMARRISEKPVWLSTAGAGVSWLHVRLDDRPKYYGHAAYRSSP
ncbi:MAG: hypothetical protein QM775_36540 [Pirellulales bacterium]